MHQLLSERGEISQMFCALGSTMAANKSIMTDHQEFSDSESVTSTNSIHTMVDTMVDQVFSEISPEAARETLNVTAQSSYFCGTL
eukprot:15338242-Ditylum_brightwellii.AAC.1